MTVPLTPGTHYTKKAYTFRVVSVTHPDTPVPPESLSVVPPDDSARTEIPPGSVGCTPLSVTHTHTHTHTVHTKARVIDGLWSTLGTPATATVCQNGRQK